MSMISFKPIGIVHSPFNQPKGTPIQPRAEPSIKGRVEVFPKYGEGLVGLGGFSHIILLYHCHLAKAFRLQVTPFLDNQAHGVFATRAPARPNSIGLSIVRLVEVDGLSLHIQGLDIVDNTPLLDIKPYVPAFDQRENVKIGWLEKGVDRLSTTEDDGRFITD